MQSDFFINEQILLFPADRLAGLIERTAQLMANSRADRGARAQLNRGIAQIDIMCAMAGLSRQLREEQERAFRQSVLDRLAELCLVEPEPPTADIVSLAAWRQSCR